MIDRGEAMNNDEYNFESNQYEEKEIVLDTSGNDPH